MDHTPLLKELYASFGKGDMPAVLAAFDADIEWREAESNPYSPDGAPWRGPQAVLEQLFMRLGGEWEGFTVTPRRFHGAGESVVVEGRYTGRFLATGRQLDVQFCHVWTVRDGRIARFQQYVDTARLREAMGA